MNTKSIIAILAVGLITTACGTSQNKEGDSCKLDSISISQYSQETNLEFQPLVQ